MKVFGSQPRYVHLYCSAAQLGSDTRLSPEGDDNDEDEYNILARHSSKESHSLIKTT